MKKFNVKIFVIFFFLLIIIASLIINLNRKNNFESKSNFLLNTIINITLYGNHSEKNFEDIFSIIRDEENLFSKTIVDSDIYKINKNAGISPIKVSNETIKIIKMAIKYSNLSDGKFDITIGPLVDIWAIGTENEKVPPTYEIENLIQYVNYKNIVIDETQNTIFLSKGKMRIDLGGIAKGYIADKIVEYLKLNNLKGAIINLGGNVVVFGENNNKKSTWSIGIQDPYGNRGSYLATIAVNNKSIVSSGTYERFFIKDGEKFHHILDTSTGFPVKNQIEEVTIISENSIDGDALSTSIFSMGIEDGLKLINSLNGIECIIITNKKEIICSKQIISNIKITNSNYTLLK